MDNIDQAQEEIEQITIEAISRVRRRVEARGPGKIYCDECGNDIPPARRLAVPGCTLCVQCQHEYETRL